MKVLQLYCGQVLLESYRCVVIVLLMIDNK